MKLSKKDSLTVNTSSGEPQQAPDQSPQGLILESISDFAIFTVNIEGCIDRWNPGAELLFGYTNAEAFGMLCDNLFTEEDRSAGIPKADRQLAIENGRAGYDHWHVRKDGSFFYANSIVTPLCLKDGIITGFTRVVRDITVEERSKTDLKRETESVRMGEVRFQLLADTITHLAWMAKPDGWTFWYNRRWFEYTGTTPAQMEGWGWQSVHDPSELDRVMERWQNSIATGEQFDLTFPIKGADGQFRSFLTRAAPSFDGEGNIQFWCGTNTDITEQLRLVQEHETMFLSERASRTAAEHANNSKDEFLATLSHELRSPLNAILAWTNVIRGGERGLFDQACEIIDRNVSTQIRLIEDLLDMSRIASGKLHIDVRPIDPISFIESALEIVMPAAAGKQIRIERAFDPNAGNVLADDVRMLQVISNLLTNAIKFTPIGGRVEIRLERVDAHIEITVADTGVGIEADFLPYVFERFRQANSTISRRHGGLGLGLSLVKQLVELHGGTVRAESAGLNLGSTFVVCLPIQRNFE